MSGRTEGTTVACLAGRRIDAEDADPVRFPAERERDVGASLSRAFALEGVSHLICSAACGADILALEASAACGIPATVVLPFASATFRRVSVTDRPGDWGARFDRAVEQARSQGALVELGLSPDDQDAFEQANGEIVKRTAAIDADRRLAVIVWDGEKEGATDITAHVRDLARARGFKVLEISSLG